MTLFRLSKTADAGGMRTLDAETQRTLNHMDDLIQNLIALSWVLEQDRTLDRRSQGVIEVQGRR